MRIGTNHWIGYAPLYLAQSQNMLNPQQFRLLEFSSANIVLRAFRNEQLDAAALTLDEALLLLHSDDEVSVVLIFDISNGADAIVSQPEITQIKQLQDKRIGLEQNVLGSYLLKRALDISHVPSDSVKTLDLEMSKQLNAFQQKEVQAVVCYEPVCSQLVSLRGNKLFDSHKIMGEIVDVLVVRNSYLEKNQKIVQKVVDAYLKISSVKIHHPEVFYQQMAKMLQTDVASIQQFYQKIIYPSGAEMKDFIQNPLRLKNTKKYFQTLCLIII